MEANCKPNIILVFADDLGYGDISCMSPSSRIHTGHIDRLAEQGMRLTDCHSTSALCCALPPGTDCLPAGTTGAPG